MKRCPCVFIIKHLRSVYTERDRERGPRLYFVLFRPTTPSSGHGRFLYKQTFIPCFTVSIIRGVLFK